MATSTSQKILRDVFKLRETLVLGQDSVQSVCSRVVLKYFDRVDFFRKDMGSFYEMVRSTFDIAKPLAFGEKFYLATVGILVVMSTIGRLPLGNLGRLARYCVSERLSLGEALENFLTRLRVMIVNSSWLPDHYVFILDDRPGGIYTSTGHRLFLPLDVRANGL